MSLWKKPPPSVPATDLERRVQDLLGKSSGGAFVMEPVEDAGFSADVATVRLPMTCGKKGRNFLAIGVVEGDIIWLSGNVPPYGDFTPARYPDLKPGSYRIGYINWSCPHCADDERVWMCACKGMFGALVCGGDDNEDGYQYCGCSRFCGRYLYRDGRPRKPEHPLTQPKLYKPPGSEDFLRTLEPNRLRPHETLNDGETGARPLIIGRNGIPERQKPVPKSPPMCRCNMAGIGYRCRGPKRGKMCMEAANAWITR